MTNIDEAWRWQIVGFKPAHVLSILSEPVQHIEAKRLVPIAVRVSELDCEIGTRTQVLAPVQLHLHQAGPFWHTGRDHLECLPLPVGIRSQLWKGLFLRLRAVGDRGYPYPYSRKPPGQIASILAALARGGRRTPPLQVELLEEAWERELLKAGQDPRNDQEYYQQKLYVKGELLAGRIPPLPGLQPLNASDKYFLRASMEQYESARKSGKPY